MAVLAVGCAGSVGSSAANVEESHGIQLPSSATDLETVGDTGLAARFGLDRGYTSVFVIDEIEWEPFLASLPDGEFAQDFGGPPGNSQYQPSSIPWGDDAPPLYSATKESPSDGDFLTVQAYETDDGRVGVMLYSDWN